MSMPEQPCKALEPIADEELAADPRDDRPSSPITEWILGEGLEPSRGAEGVAPSDVGKAKHIAGVAIGVLVELGERGPLVDFPDNPESSPILARAAVALTSDDVLHEVALLFEGGDPARPILIGRMHQPGAASARPYSPAPPPKREPDPEQLVFAANKEIVLRCGKASITLTRAGKILLRGTYLLTDASGVNRIRGGTVAIN